MQEQMKSVWEKTWQDIQNGTVNTSHVAGGVGFSTGFLLCCCPLTLLIARVCGDCRGRSRKEEVTVKLEEEKREESGKERMKGREPEEAIELGTLKKGATEDKEDLEYGGEIRCGDNCPLPPRTKTKEREETKEEICVRCRPPMSWSNLSLSTSEEEEKKAWTQKFKRITGRGSVRNVAKIKKKGK